MYLVNRCIEEERCASLLNVTTTTAYAANVGTPSIRGRVVSKKKSTYSSDTAAAVITGISMFSLFAMLYTAWRVNSTKQRPRSSVNIFGISKAKRKGRKSTKAKSKPVLRKLNSTCELLPSEECENPAPPRGWGIDSSNSSNDDSSNKSSTSTVCSVQGSADQVKYVAPKLSKLDSRSELLEEAGDERGSMGFSQRDSHLQ